MATSSRDPSLDLIRIVAITMVVVLHANAGQASNFTEGWWISNLINSATRMAVPLFVILSGALIIPRREPLSKHGTRLLRIAVPLLIWSYIYVFWLGHSGVLWGYLWGFPVPSVRDPYTLVSIFRYPVMFHLHFLYAIIGLYLFMPVLQAAFAAADRATMIYFLALCFVFAGFLPTLNATTGTSWFGVHLQSFSLYVGYAMFGALVRDYTPSRPMAWGFLGLSIGFIAITAALIAVDSTSRGQASEIFAEYGSPNVILSAVFAYLAMRGLVTSVGKRTANLWQRAARAAFGIYFVHVIVIYYAFQTIPPLGFEARVVMVSAVAVSTMLLSLLVTWLLQTNRITRWLAPV